MADGKVLLHRAEADAFRSLPGGRVERDETAVEALARELREEVGRTFRLERQLWTHQHSFEHGGAVFEERGHYHFAAPKVGAFLLKTAPLQGEERDRGLVFDWFDFNELIHVDCRPQFIEKDWTNS